MRKLSVYFGIALLIYSFSIGLFAKQIYNKNGIYFEYPDGWKVSMEKVEKDFVQVFVETPNPKDAASFVVQLYTNYQIMKLQKYARSMSKTLQSGVPKGYKVRSYGFKPVAIKVGKKKLKAVVESYKIKRKKEEKARMARIAREKAEKIARNQIIVVLESGKSYFGQENEKSFFGQDRELPFRILFESFDKQSGAVSGIMDYYPENDRSIIKFSGMLKGSTLTYQLKKIDRKGKSGIQTGKYTYRVGQNRLEGTYNEGEKVWINISVRRQLSCPVRRQLS